MTQPTPYRRGYDFSDAGGAQPPGGPLDNELDALARTTRDTLRNLALIQRDDTALRNGIVGIDALDSRVLGLISGGTFSIAGAWATATSYPAGAFLTDDGAIYLVMEAHTSTSIVDDLAAGRIAKALQNEQGSRLRDDFIGNAVQTAFSLSQSPARPSDVEVYADGSLVPPGDYVQTGATVTFDVAPANGAKISIFSITWATAPPIQTLVDAVGDRNLEISAASQFLDEVGIGGAALVGELDARPTTAALASPAGGGMVGLADGSTIQDAANKIVGVPKIPQFQRVLAKLDNADFDASILLVGDSTGNEVGEWYYRFAQGVAVANAAWTVRHALWNDGTGAFDAPTIIQAGTGPRVLTFWNGSIAGSIATRHAGDNFDAVIVATAPDLIFNSYGHNGGSPVLGQVDYYNCLFARVDRHSPDIPVIVIGQNPTLSDETMAPKVDAFRAMAARRGYGFIDVHAAFKQDPRPLSELLADEVHPNNAGSQLWADTVLAAFNASRAMYGGGALAPSSLLKSWSRLQDFRSWALANIDEPTTDTAHFETLGYSVNLASTAAANAWAYDLAVTSSDIIAVRGQYVTFAVWMRVDPSNPESSGRLEVADDFGSTTAYPTLQYDGFVLFSCTHRVNEAATYVRVYIYPTVEAVSGAVQIDRATLALGLSPIDILPPQEFSTRRLSLIGSDADGIGVLVNGATSGAGLRGLLDEADDPATEYVSDYSADRAAFKSKADAAPTVILDKTGLKAGDGTGGTTLTISLRFSNGWGCAGHWYPQTANTYDLGGPGLEWARVLLNQGVWVGGNQVVGARKTGWALATGTATRTAFDTASVTLPQLAERVKALIDDLHATAGHGMIGT